MLSRFRSRSGFVVSWDQIYGREAEHLVGLVVLERALKGPFGQVATEAR